MTYDDPLSRLMTKRHSGKQKKIVCQRERVGCSMQYDSDCCQPGNEGIYSCMYLPPQFLTSNSAAHIQLLSSLVSHIPDVESNHQMKFSVTYSRSRVSQPDAILYRIFQSLSLTTRCNLVSPIPEEEPQHQMQFSVTYSRSGASLPDAI